MSEELNALNIPAFKRKRSIAAKLRKTNKTTTTKPRLSTTRKKREKFDTSGLFTDIPARKDTRTVEDLLSLPEESFEQELRTMDECGYCDGYFEKIDVAIVKVTSPVRLGDCLIFERDGGLFEHRVESMQIDRKDVKLARSGSDIGLKIPMKPKVGTPVYKVNK